MSLMSNKKFWVLSSEFYPILIEKVTFMIIGLIFKLVLHNLQTTEQFKYFHSLPIPWYH